MVILSFYQKLESNPGYLTELIATRNEAYQPRYIANIPFFSFKHNFFKKTFFPSTILEWNKLDASLQNSASYNVIKNCILKFRPSPNNIFQCHNPKGMKLVTRLRLGLSHLREDKFKHSFQDTHRTILLESPYFLTWDVLINIKHYTTSVFISILSKNPLTFNWNDIDLQKPRFKINHEVLFKKLKSHGLL